MLNGKKVLRAGVERVFGAGLFELSGNRSEIISGAKLQSVGLGSPQDQGLDCRHSGAPDEAW